MDNFKQKFLEEAHDLIIELEKSVLALDKTPNDKSLIEAVFRVMHSLKGGGAMFGFELVSAFTHDLENVYENIRNGKYIINKEIINITFDSVDHLRDLLKDNALDDIIIANAHKNLLERIKHVYSTPDLHILEEVEDIKINILPDTKIINTYLVCFQPHHELFENGTNPLYLLDELKQYSKSYIPFVNISELPDLENINPEYCYSSWSILLASSEEKEALSDVFIFIFDECKIDIQIISPGNLIVDEKFKTKIELFYKSGRNINCKEIINLLHKNEDDIKTDHSAAVEIKTKESAIASIRVASDKIDRLMNLVSELVTTQARLSLYADKSRQTELTNIAENVEYLTRQLRDNAFGISLIPVETVLTRFHRLVRDLSDELGKKVEFKTDGANTELDKNLIQNLTEPIMHLIRNAIDHGIEYPEERMRLGKPETGIIFFKAFYSGAFVHFQVKDDGKGINLEYIREKAINKGFITAENPLSDKDLLELIFLPGFTTTRNVTDVSGRGVGLDVVKRKIAEVRGDVNIDFIPGKETCFTIKIPLTLSIIDGLLVAIHNTKFIIPLSVVDKIYAAHTQQIYDAYNNIIVLDRKQLPFLNLRIEFEMTEDVPEWHQIVVVKFDNKLIGLAVDSVMGEYQALLKPLGKHYRNQEYIPGATILGDGTIALVIDTNKIVQKFTSINQ